MQFTAVRRSNDLARAKEIVTAFDEWQAADAALRAGIGCDACDEEIARADNARFKIEGEIVRTPATTMEGLRIKVRLALSVSGPPNPAAATNIRGRRRAGG